MKTYEVRTYEYALPLMPSTVYCVSYKDNRGTGSRHYNDRSAAEALVEELKAEGYTYGDTGYWDGKALQGKPVIM